MVVTLLLWDCSCDWSFFFLQQWNIKSNTYKIWWSINISLWSRKLLRKKGFTLTRWVFPLRFHVTVNSCALFEVLSIYKTNTWLHSFVTAEHLNSKPWSFICYCNSLCSSGKALKHFKYELSTVQSCWTIFILNICVQCQHVVPVKEVVLSVCSPGGN